MACASGANYCKWGQGGGGGEVEEGYIISQHKVEQQLHCFGIGGEIFLLNSFMTPNKN